jgi:hypothetical protein
LSQSSHSLEWCVDLVLGLPAFFISGMSKISFSEGFSSLKTDQISGVTIPIGMVNAATSARKIPGFDAGVDIHFDMSLTV